MQTRSIDEQLALCRSTAGAAVYLQWWMLTGAALGVLAAGIAWHPVPLMIAVFLGLVGVSSRRVGPNMAASVLAYETSEPTRGEVVVEITCWDSGDHYHAVVHEAVRDDWKYEFIPQGWKPTAGRFAARIWWAADGRPVLAVVDEGVMIPRNDVTRVEAKSAEDHD